MLLATTQVEDFDRFKEIFTTKGAEKRREHGSKGALVFRDPNEDGRVWVIFDWDAEGFQRFASDPEVPPIMRAAGHRGKPQVARTASDSCPQSRSRVCTAASTTTRTPKTRSARNCWDATTSCTQTARCSQEAAPARECTAGSVSTPCSSFEAIAASGCHERRAGGRGRGADICQMADVMGARCP
jgi:hypothetical protein